jgi:hypothetical protein
MVDAVTLNTLQMVLEGCRICDMRAVTGRNGGSMDEYYYI